MLTYFQKTLPTFPSDSQNQLKLLNVGTNPVTVKLPGNNPLNLAAAQVRALNNNYNTKLCTMVGRPSLKSCENHGFQNISRFSMYPNSYPNVCTVSTIFCFVLFYFAGE